MHNIRTALLVDLETLSNLEKLKVYTFTEEIHYIVKDKTFDWGHFADFWQYMMCKTFTYVAICIFQFFTTTHVSHVVFLSFDMFTGTLLVYTKQPYMCITNNTSIITWISFCHHFKSSYHLRQQCNKEIMIAMSNYCIMYG